MQKAQKFLQQLIADYETIQGYPTLAKEFNSSKLIDQFSSSYSGGVINLKASNFHSAIYGLSLLKASLSSKHLIDYLGETKACFSLRPLWLESLHVDHNWLCQRVIELGYNAIVFKSLEKTFLQDQDFSTLCDCLHSYGLKIILKFQLEEKPSLIKCPLDKNFQEAISEGMSKVLENFPHIDYLFWESILLNPLFFFHQEGENFTTREMALKEAYLIEKTIGNKAGLIYYIPANDLKMAEQQSEWIPSFCDDVGNRTIIAFSAVAGDFFYDHLPPHPLWNKLRILPDRSAVQFLSILNSGNVKQGEGLWPSLTLDLVDNYIYRSKREDFAGIMMIASHMPSPGSLLDCSLWVAAKSLWQNLSSLQLVETWFAAYRPDLSFSISELKSIREMIVQLSLLKSQIQEKNSNTLSSDEGKLIAERLLIQLKEIEKKLKKEDKDLERDKPSLVDYFTFFARDAKRIIHSFIQCYHIPLHHTLSGDDLLDSFWTKSHQGGTQGLQAASKISLLDEPQKGLPGSVMRKIWDENYRS